MWLETLLALLVLVGLEIALGIDNLVFISLLLQGLPPDVARKYRNWGIGLAILARLVLIFFIVQLLTLDQLVLLSVGKWAFTIKDLILFAGGTFLLLKSTWEIHRHIEGASAETSDSTSASVKPGLWLVLQIVWVDLVFAVDSVLTAVALTRQVWLMAVAIVIAAFSMGAFALPLSRFIHRHPSILMLALTFVWTIGLLLVLEAFGVHVPRGYVYAALAFSMVVELLNIKARHR